MKKSVTEALKGNTMNYVGEGKQHGSRIVDVGAKVCPVMGPGFKSQPTGPCSVCSGGAMVGGVLVLSVFRLRPRAACAARAGFSCTKFSCSWCSSADGPDRPGALACVLLQNLLLGPVGDWVQFELISTWITWSSGPRSVNLECM